MLQKTPHSIKVVLLIVIATRITIFSFGFATSACSNNSIAPLSILMNQFSHWDSMHYIDIAKNGYIFQGYQQDFIVYFPLYPALIRLFTFDFAYINLSALVISNISSAVAAVFLFKLAKVDFGDTVARKAVTYFCIFPTAYFLAAIYTESLFLALTISSFYYARMEKWWAAGFLSMFAALTRLGGLLLLPALLIEYIHQKKWALCNFDRKVLCVFFALAGFLIYLLINFHVAGNPFAFMDIYRTNWNLSVNPVMGFQRAVEWSISAPFPENMYTLAELSFAAFGLFMVCAGVMLRFRLSYNVYLLLTWMLSVSTSWWMSVPRYLIAMFPMFILMGTLVKEKSVHYTLTATSAALLCLFTVLFTSNQFVF
jgi:hypothetical protein